MIKDKITFKDSWDQYFQVFGLSTFDDFYSFSGASTVNTNKRRNVQKFTLGEGGDQKVFFMKRFHNSHLKDIFAAAYNFARPISQARVELKNAEYLLRNGIDTYKPICIGERGHHNIETTSFLITEQLDSVCLLESVIESWHSLSRTEQDNIIVGVAEFVRKIHALDVSFPDMYLWHLFIRQENLGEKIHFSVIDLHRMTQNRRSLKRKIKELSRLYWSMSADYFDDAHKNLLITTYLGNTSAMNKETVLRIIRRYSATLEKRRILKNHYSYPKAVCSPKTDPVKVRV